MKSSRLKTVDWTRSTPRESPALLVTVTDVESWIEAECVAGADGFDIQKCVRQVSGRVHGISNAAGCLTISQDRRPLHERSPSGRDVASNLSREGDRQVLPRLEVDGGVRIYLTKRHEVRVPSQ